jgi:hypothetical protein
MEILIAFLILLAIAFTVASWSRFIDECLQEGDIFDFWGKVVKKEIWHNKNIQDKKGYLQSCCQLTEKDVEEYDSQKLKVPKWKMPLGGCVICTNVWWTILTSTLIFGSFSLYYPIVTFILIALSNTFVKILK